jgi:hypothetical protein
MPEQSSGARQTSFSDTRITRRRNHCHLAAVNSRQPGNIGICLIQNTRRAGASNYILNTPNLVSGIDAFSAAEKASANIRRVSDGVIIPSSHNRAVA